VERLVHAQALVRGVVAVERVGAADRSRAAGQLAHQREGRLVVGRLKHSSHQLRSAAMPVSR
jgi:hypothetical protein